MHIATGAVKVPAAIGVVLVSTVVMYPVVGKAVSYRGIIPTVWIVIDHTMRIKRSCIIYMPWTVDIGSVVRTNVPSAVGVVPVRIIEDVQATHPYDAVVGITDFYITGLDDASKLVVINRNILYLDYSTVVVVLHVSIVIVTGVVRDAYPRGIDVDVYLTSVVTSHIDKVELSIGEYGKLYATFHEDVRITIVVIAVGSGSFTGSVHGEGRQEESEYECCYCFHNVLILGLYLR